MRLETGSLFPVSIVPFAACNPFHKVSMALVDNDGSELIKWPQRPALRNTTEKSENMKGVLDVVGEVRGTHISIKAPTENPNDYVNQKFLHFVQFENESVDFN